LGASAGAIGTARYFLGQAPDFQVAAIAYPGPGTLPVHLALGTGIALIGVAYNRAILVTLRATNRLGRGSPVPSAAAIGATVGLLAWRAPGLTGAGDPITQQMLGGTASVLDAGVAAFGLVILVRFLLGAVSYAARTPGGLFVSLVPSAAFFLEPCASARYRAQA